MSISDIGSRYEHIALAVQRVFRSTPLVLVGSGFSCGYGLPSMSSLGDHLADSVDGKLQTDESRQLWHSVIPAVQANLEDGLNRVPISAAGRPELIKIIREQTAAFIIEHNSIAEKAILARPNADGEAAVRLIKRLYRGAPQNAECIPIITTNYDTLLELFCDLAQLPLDTGFAGFRRRVARSNPLFQPTYRRSTATTIRSAQYEHHICLAVRLIKPHGSITWQTHNGTPTEVIGDLTDLSRSIVIPGPTKYEDALINVLFDSMRSAMNTQVSRASSLLCIGFGFNDDHLQGVLKGRLEQGMQSIILTRSFTPSIENILDQHPHVLGIQMRENGAEARLSGETLELDEPVWQLDTFLKKFVE